MAHFPESDKVGVENKFSWNVDWRPSRKEPIFRLFKLFLGIVDGWRACQCGLNSPAHRHRPGSRNDRFNRFKKENEPRHNTARHFYNKVHFFKFPKNPTQSNVLNLNGGRKKAWTE